VLHDMIVETKKNLDLQIQSILKRLSII
jgi:hypothetical protein